MTIVRERASPAYEQAAQSFRFTVKAFAVLTVLLLGALVEVAATNYADPEHRAMTADWLVSP